MEETPIDKYTLRFPDELERIYQEETFHHSLKQLRINILVVTLIYAFFGILDALVTPEVKYQAWFIRFVIVLPVALSVLGFSFSPHFKQYHQIAVSFLSVVGGGCLVALIVLTQRSSPYFHFAGLLLVFMTVFAAFKLRFLYATVACWIIIGLYEISAIWISHVPLRIFLTDNFYYISAVLMGMSASYQRELYGRKEFLQARHQQLSEQQKHTVEKERLNEAVDRAVRSLSESEARFRALAETTSASTIIHRGGRFLYTNPAVQKSTGYTREELLRMEFWELVHPGDRNLVRERGLARISGRDIPPEYEFRVVTKYGDERWVSNTSGPIDFEGAPAIIATLFDITDRKRAEADTLRSFEERIREEARHRREKEGIMMELHDGVGGITTNISILSELAQKSDSPGFIKSTLTTISQLSREGILEIRSFMRSLDTDEMSWHSLAAEIRNQGNSTLEPHGITFSLETTIGDVEEPQPGSLLCVNLFKIFREALTNIIKHAKATSVRVSLRIAGSRLQLTLEDNGIGLENAGTIGRGLSNMKKRAAELGGVLDFSSGNGARMSLELPLRAQRQVRAGGEVVRD